MADDCGKQRKESAAEDTVQRRRRLNEAEAAQRIAAVSRRQTSRFGGFIRVHSRQSVCLCLLLFGALKES